MTVALLGALVAGFLLAAPTVAHAAPGSGEGWLRLGHFSPDTKEVDVRVTALAGGSTVLDLSGVGYGVISPYAPLAPGTYTVAMVGAGTDAWNTPVISAEVTVDAGSASTVAAYGPNTDLQVQAFTDDLTAPAPGAARLRVIQASTVTPTVDIQTSTGVSVARAARSGTATSYTEVPAGAWTLQLSGTNVSDTASVDVAAGSITTLFVLDTADQRLTILPVLDSAAAAAVPEGGVQTGGGALAVRSGSLMTADIR